MALLALVALGSEGVHGAPQDGSPPGDDVEPQPAPPRSPPAEGGAGARALLRGKPLDVNRAGRADLMLLPRIGPALADRILADREARGPFGSLRELTRVKGIGEATVAGLRGLATAATDSEIQKEKQATTDQK